MSGVFDAATTGGVVFHAAGGLDAPAVAAVQACVPALATHLRAPPQAMTDPAPAQAPLWRGLLCVVLHGAVDKRALCPMALPNKT
jgi:hypothetical protein